MPEIERGARVDLLNQILANTTSLVSGSGSLRHQNFGVAAIDIDNLGIFGLILVKADGNIVSTAEITDVGTYTIDRVRAGVTTNIVAATANSETAGRVFFTYTFVSADWAIDDMVSITFSGVEVTIGAGPAYSYPDIPFFSLIVDQTAISTIVTSTEGTVTHVTHGNAALKVLIDAVQATADAIETDTQSIEGKVDTIDTVVDGIQTDLDNATDGLGAIRTAVDDVQTDVTSIETKVDTANTNILALNDVSKAEVNIEVDLALDTAVVTPPTTNALTDLLHKDGSFTYDNTTDSNEAIADAVAAVTVTAGGSSTLTERIAGALGPELIENGNCEAATSWITQSNGVVTLQDTTHIHGGTYAVKVDATNNNNSGMLQDAGTNHPWSQAKVGDQFYVGLWAYTTTTGGHPLRIIVGDTAGSSLNDFLPGTIPQDTWTWVETVLTISIEIPTVGIRLRIINDNATPANGLWWFDDITLRPVLGAPRDGLDKDKELTYDPATDSQEVLGEVVATIDTATIDIRHKNGSLTYDNAIDSLEAISDQVMGVFAYNDVDALSGSFLSLIDIELTKEGIILGGWIYPQNTLNSSNNIQVKLISDINGNPKTVWSKTYESLPYDEAIPIPDDNSGFPAPVFGMRGTVKLQFATNGTMSIVSELHYAARRHEVS